MKNFLGKIIIFSFFSFISCNNCKNDDFLSNFKKNKVSFQNAITIIDEKKLFDIYDEIDSRILEKILNIEDLLILKKIHFVHIRKTSDVLIFKFSNNHKSSLLEQKIGKSLDTSSELICEFYLFFNKNITNRHEVVFYEQYSECRYEYKDLGNWTFVNLKKPCSD